MKGLKWPFSASCVDIQTAFNGVAVSFILLSSLGLWTCLLEIDKLKHSTENVAKTVSRMSNPGPIVNGRPLAEDLRDAEPNARVARSVYPKRDDDRSEKDMEFCLNLVVKKCGGSLPGISIQGPTGRPGPPGAPGGVGPPGRPGAMGHMGPPGINGLKGQKGEEGHDGRVGEPGSDGPRGTPGLPGVNGIPGPEGRRGKRGIPGPPGLPGTRGPPGLSGLKGEKGETGYPPAMSPMELRERNCTCYGEKGEKGQRGLVGFSGYKGEKGSDIQGLRGPMGPPGLKGEKGDSGYCHYSNCANYIRPKGTRQEQYTVEKETTTEPTTTTTVVTTTPTTVPTEPPTLSPRAEVCTIKRVGIPDLFDNKQEGHYGSVLHDMHQPNKLWLAHGFYGQKLIEYKTVQDFEKGNIDTLYNLEFNRYYGTQHAIYNNSFYYQLTGKSAIVRYDLVTRNVLTMVEIPYAHYNDSNYVYKDSRIYFDITADDNGVWVVYGRQRGDSSNLHVMKLSLDTLLVERVWTLPVELRRHGNSFIACGTLYLIDGMRGEKATIVYSYDLYTDIAKEVDIEIIFPFKSNTMLSFSGMGIPETALGALWGWDDGYVLKYPLLF